MPECTGDEILTELSFHLGILDKLDNIIENTIVRTAFMPYITSMFMPRAKETDQELFLKDVKSWINRSVCRNQ